MGIKNNGFVTTKEMTKAVSEFAKHIPPISEEEIKCVMMNPSLSWFQKIRISLRMKSIMRRGKM